MFALPIQKLRISLNLSLPLKIARTIEAEKITGLYF